MYPGRGSVLFLRTFIQGTINYEKPTCKYKVLGGFGKVVSLYEYLI